MTVVVELKPKTEELLRKAANAKGVGVDGYLEFLIEKDAERLFLEERLAPVRKSLEESGMTEDDLDDFMNDIRAKVRAERKQVKDRHVRHRA
jgi:hypothetical protein